MKFNDLRQFIAYLEASGELKRIAYPVSPAYEITEIADRVLRAGGPALLFENPIGYDMPVLANLFGTPKRVALGMGQQEVSALREVGKLLAYLKEPQPPKGWRDLLQKLPALSKIRHMPVKRVKNAPCQQIVWTGEQVDLDKLPIMSCWPQDVAPLLTWGLTNTKGPHKKRQNLGIYRQQKLARNKIIMRWLAHRGGALDLQDWIKTHPNQPFPVSVAFGADPATILAAVTPIPDTLSEYAFAGLLRGGKSEVVKSISNELDVPAAAEIVLEGYIDPNEFADEGPYGDHTGYYNEVERHRVFTITHITMCQSPIYHSTYTGRPPDEPAVLGVALNEVFVPILQKQFPEIVDFYLPPEGCSYRMAVVTINKQYAGHAKRIMMGVWSFLRQFMYTKCVIVCDESVNARAWDSVALALAQHFAPKRDTLIIEHTPIDSLDFASPVVGLGSKIGLDATIKWQAELEVELAPIVEREMENHQALSLLHPDIIATHMLGASVLAAQIQPSPANNSRALLEQIWQQAPEVKLVLLCDQDVNITDWQDIIWALTTRVDPARDSVIFTQDKWSQLSFDATNKSSAQVSREWGKPIHKDPQLVAKIDAIWEQLGLTL